MRAISPLFTVLTPVYNPPPAVLRDTIASVRSQTFDDWELVLVDDASPDPSVLSMLREAAAADSRIRVIERRENGHIVAASNDGVVAAHGEYLALLDHDDLLTVDALERVAEHLGPHVDYLYSDEDKIDEESKHLDVFHKPTWSPERLLGQMYTGHLSVLRTNVVRRVGAFRPGYEGSQDHDLVLRVTEAARDIVHIPEVLYHWRLVRGSAAADPHAKPYAQIAGQKAVQDALDRRHDDATAEFIPDFPGCYRLQRRLPPQRTVSLVIPTRGTESLIWGQRRVLAVEACRSALENTDHANIEVVLVYDTATPASVLDAAREVCGDRLVLVHFDKPFNFSEKCNVGALAASGDRIVLLNDDIRVRSPGWLERLVGPLEDPSVGMTGAKLYFADGTLQHVGHSYNRGEYLHPYLGVPGENPGFLSELVVNREVSGVTAAASALSRSVFEEVGGLCEELPVNFNDVDLSYKVRSRGYRILFVANCELYHFESKTRHRVVHGWERDIVVHRWGRPSRDPFMPEA